MSPVGYQKEEKCIKFKVILHSRQRRNSTYCLLEFVECVYLFVCVHKYHTANNNNYNNNSTKEKRNKSTKHYIISHYQNEPIQ